MMTTGGVCVPVREEDRREASQAQAKRNGNGDTPQRSEVLVTSTSSEDTQSTSSSRGVPVSKKTQSDTSRDQS